MKILPRRRLLRPLLSALLLGVVVAACSSGPMRVDEKAHGYSYDALPVSRWAGLEIPASTDRAWQSKKGGGLVALRSVCGRYDHVTLKALTQNLINTIQEPQLASQEGFALAGREALRTVVQGKVDGVPVESVFVVLRKDDCIFDFALTARDSLDAKDREDFEAFVASLRYSGLKKEGSSL
jgi:hypothetical protein